MKIQLMSDLHLEFGTFTPPDTGADLVILAGDVHVKQHGIAWARKHFSCPVVYVPGNHEHYGSSLGRTPEKLKEQSTGSNVHVLNNDVLELDGVRVLGTTLWTDYRISGNQPLAELDAMLTMKDFKHVRSRSYGRLRPAQLVAEHARSRTFLRETLSTPFKGATVVVTHHAPSGQSLSERHCRGLNNASYASDLEQFMGGDAVALWCHGHVHDTFDYNLCGTRVVCNPRGYSPDKLNPKFNPGLTVELP